MIVYSEEQYRHLSTFTKSVISNDGDIVSQRKVTCPLYKIEKNGFLYFVLYDDNMRVIHDAFEYLNYDMRRYPFNTRRSAAYALRYLYCYLSLSGLSDKQINKSSFDGLVQFLRGIGLDKEDNEFKTMRSGKTVNTYLGVYRKYFKKREIACSALFESHVTKSEIIFDNDYSQMTQRLSYDNNVKTKSVAVKEVPKYVSPDEFRRLYELALENRDTTSMLIMHLMYGYGMRLGEVLGMTIEDITEIHENGKLFPVIILRNRISDKDFQNAKNLMHATTPDQYKKDPEYKKAKAYIYITYDIYQDLINYVNDVHEKMMNKYPGNYAEGMADIVSSRNAPEFNHYVFLNQYGRVLSDQTFNNHLKKYYKKAGIPLDYGIKKDNLGHRLRHGFAMFHAHFSPNPVDIKKLKDMMRHEFLTSTMIYYNPTAEEILKIKTEFQEELYKYIPELKGGIA